MLDLIEDFLPEFVSALGPLFRAVFFISFEMLDVIG